MIYQKPLIEIRNVCDVVTTSGGTDTEMNSYVKDDPWDK